MQVLHESSLILGPCTYVRRVMQVLHESSLILGPCTYVRQLMQVLHESSLIRGTCMNHYIILSLVSRLNVNLRYNHL